MLLDQRVRDQLFYTRSFIESSIDALITTDPRGIITEVNKKMEALTGCMRDERAHRPRQGRQGAPWSPTTQRPSRTAGPAEVAARLNRLFPFDAATEQFATMIYGIFDTATAEFDYVSAGHPGTVHLPSGADPVILESEGFPIGLADEAYVERSVRLQPGDRLYLYSGRVPESMDPAGNRFRVARLLQAITNARSEPIEESIVTLLKLIAAWNGPERPGDDIPVLAVERAVDRGASVA